MISLKWELKTLSLQEWNIFIYLHRCTIPNVIDFTQLHNKITRFSTQKFNSRISSTHPTHSSFATTSLWQFSLDTHSCSKIVVTPLSCIIKCSLTPKTLIWLLNAHITQYFLASSGGDMDICTTSFSILSPFFTIIIIEFLIHFGNGGTSLK